MNTQTLIYPVAGINRRLGYQMQPPYTCVDALNVQTVDAFEGRGRGGSRYGFGKALCHPTHLGTESPIMMLTYHQFVDTNSVASPATFMDTFENKSLSSKWMVSGNDGLAPLVSQDGMAYANYGYPRGAVYVPPSLSKTSHYRVMLSCIPYNGSFANCTYRLYLMTGSHGIPTRDGIIAEIAIDGSLAATVTIKTYTDSVESVLFNSAWSPSVGMLKPPMFIDLAADTTLKLTWSGVSLYNSILPSLAGVGAGFGLTSASAGVRACVDKVRVDYYPNEGSSKWQNMVVCSAGGRLFAETFPGDLNEISLGASLLQSHEPISSTSYLGLLYMTDTRDAGAPVVNDASVNVTNDEGQLVYLSSEGPNAIKVYDPEAGTVADLTASAGSVPADCSLIATYNDRIVLAKDKSLPHLWYMSRQGDPTDYDYGADPDDPGKAVYGLVGFAGQIPEPILALAAVGDDYLVVGCLSSMWVIRGDPGYGGRIDNISRRVGIVGPRAWCIGDRSEFYWMAPAGLYAMAPGASTIPEPLSPEVLPRDLVGIDGRTQDVVLAWDTVLRAVHVYVAGSEYYWVFDVQNGAWWKWKLPDDFRAAVACSHYPVGSTDGGVLIGSHDGYIRCQNRHLAKDELTEIYSYVVIGPVKLSEGAVNTGQLCSVMGATDTQSATVTWAMKVGDSAESAYEADFEYGGLLEGGRSKTWRPRRRGSVLYVGLFGGEATLSGGALVLGFQDRLPAMQARTQAWTFEDIGIETQEVGRIR